MKLQTVPNRIDVSTFQVHTVNLPQCCPVSNNPMPGSVLWICYRPIKEHIEAYSLEAYIKSFIGGQKCPYSGSYVVRDMEAMIQQITQHSADTVGTKVRGKARLILDCGEMLLTCRATPTN